LTLTLSSRAAAATIVPVIKPGFLISNLLHVMRTGWLRV
jgi:hypothetical protein